MDFGSAERRPRSALSSKLPAVEIDEDVREEYWTEIRGIDAGDKS
jgi:hypothetical protein